MTRHHHSLLREAADAGYLGAGVVFLWFLVLDTIAGRPLWTPNVIGRALVGQPAAPGLDFVSIVAYVFLSLVLFNLLAAVLVGLVHLAIRQPTLLVGLLLVLAMFEVFFYGASYGVLKATGLGLSWPALFGAHLAALLAMGWYLARHHQIIGRWLARVPLGDTGDEAEVRTPTAWRAMGSWRLPWWRKLAGR
jgi:hypothetical protein